VLERRGMDIAQWLDKRRRSSQDHGHHQGGPDNGLRYRWLQAARWPFEPDPVHTGV